MKRFAALTIGNQQHTFATALQAAGYRTGMMGKYLNGYQPQDPVPPGWSEWDVAGNGYPQFDYSLNENGRVVDYGHQPSDYLTDVLNRKGQDFIGQSAKAGKPFMLELATFAPHAPFTPAPRDANKFPGLKAPRGPAFNEADMSDKPMWIKNHPKLTEQQINKIDTSFRKRAQVRGVRGRRARVLRRAGGPERARQRHHPRPGQAAEPAQVDAAPPGDVQGQGVPLIR